MCVVAPRMRLFECVASCQRVAQEVLLPARRVVLSPPSIPSNGLIRPYRVTYRVITSVTSATVVATSAVAGWGVALGAGGALLVIGLLVALEMLGATDGPVGQVVARLLRVATGPLLVVFAVSIVTKAVTILAQ